MNQNLLRAIRIEAEYLKELHYDKFALEEKIKSVVDRLNSLLNKLEKELPEPPR